MLAETKRQTYDISGYQGGGSTRTKRTFPHRALILRTKYQGEISRAVEWRLDDNRP